MPLRPLMEGAEWEGLVSKITDYGFFVRMGDEQHMGLVHVSSLCEERLDTEDVPDFIEETVGPVGSKVRVQVLSLQFKGKKRVSLQLLDVISRDQMEDIVFARPRDKAPVEVPGVDRYNDELPQPGDETAPMIEDDDMRALVDSGFSLAEGLVIEEVEH